MTTTLTSPVEPLRARLLADADIPAGPLAEKVTTWSLGPSAKVHPDRRCPALDNVQASRLVPTQIALADLSTPRSCQRCEHRPSSEQASWSRTISYLRAAREETLALADVLDTLLATPEPDRGPRRAELAATLVALESSLEGLRDADDDLDALAGLAVSHREDLTTLLREFYAVVGELRRLAVSEAHSFDAELELRIRTELAVNADIRRSAQHLASAFVEDSVPDLSILRARARFASAGAPQVLVCGLFEVGLHHLRDTGLRAALPDLLAAAFAELEDDLLPRTDQLPATHLDPTPYLREGRLDLEAFAQAAWVERAAEVRAALVTAICADLDTHLDATRQEGDDAPALVALGPSATGSWRGLDLPEILTRFERLATHEELVVYAVPTLVARWIDVVCASYEAQLAGARTELDSPEVVAAAASLASDTPTPLGSFADFLPTARELFVTT